MNESVPPTSRVTAAPATATTTPIAVEFTAADPAPSSGLSHVVLYVMEPGATTYAAVAVASPDAGRLSWSPAKDGTHDMYTVAVDRKGNVEPAPAQPDATTRLDLLAPTVTAHAPTGTSVNVTAKVTVTFSEQMDRAATQQAFRLLRPDGTAVAGAFSWSGTTMTFAPSAKLARTTTYEARVATTAKDLAGRTLASDHGWTFQTS